MRKLKLMLRINENTVDKNLCQFTRVWLIQLRYINARV